jgi:hypothetical protein
MAVNRDNQNHFDGALVDLDQHRNEALLHLASFRQVGYNRLIGKGCKS